MTEPNSNRRNDQSGALIDLKELDLEGPMPSCCDLICDDDYLELVILGLAAARTEQLIYSGKSDEEAVYLADCEKDLRLSNLAAGNEVLALLGELTPKPERGDGVVCLCTSIPEVFK